MQSISNLQYNPLGSQGDLIALQVLVAGTDTSWTIQNQGTATGGEATQNVDPKWLLVDNIANNGSVTVTMGIFTVTVPPYQREPIPIPSGTKSFAFGLTVGGVNVFFSENKLADVQGNFLQIQSTAVKTLIYAFVNYNAGPQAQLTSDLNTSTLFSPTVADMAYNLLPMNAPVGNGWLQFVFNNGTKNVSLTPNGTNQLQYNGKAYTNAAPLILYPGAWGYLESDSAVWYFSGFVGNNVTSVASAATTNVFSGSETETVVISGSVGITGFDAAQIGMRRSGYFSGAPLLTNSATFILPGGANIQAAANDRFEAISLGGAAGWLISDYVKADGTAVVAPIASIIQTFNASGTWTKPSGGSMAFIEVWGSGGGGAGSSGANGSGGGGGGGYTRVFVPLALLGATETVTVNPGGAGGVSVGNGGSPGANSFGAWAIATSGAGGINSGGAGGAGGIGLTGQGGPGGSGAGLNPGFTGGQIGGGGGGGSTGGGGAGAGGGVNNTYGTSPGGVGGAGKTTVSGTDGSAPNGGGGGANGAHTGGAGATGQVRITVY